MDDKIFYDEIELYLKLMYANKGTNDVNHKP